GNDTYVYGRGDGNDVIRETGAVIFTDTLKLTDLNLADITLARAIADPNDLLVTVNATGETITVDDHFLGNDKGIEQIRFADGPTINGSHPAAAAWLRGPAGVDTIMGTTADDTLYGRGGADTLDGAGGSDTYLYAVGDGNDVIQESGSG